MTAKDEFRKRLRAAMTAAGLKPKGADLERAFNRQWRGTPITLQSATNWINGKHIPRADRLRVLAKVLRTDPHAFMYGPPESMTVAEGRGPWKDPSTQAERQVIDTFLGLPEPQRVIVRDVINGFAAANGDGQSNQD